MTALDLVGLARLKPVHFMGIGGAGMAPLAALVQHSGGTITGCDSQESGNLVALRAGGIEIEVGHHPGHVEGCAALVLTAAVSSDHPEVHAAREAGIPVLKRAEALGSVVNRGRVIGVAGTHGKTTTTALTTAALAAAGLEPTGLVGGRVPAWGGNLRIGSDTLYVVEADEYDRSFLTLRPSIAVVTTLEADHLDIFGTLSGVEDAFLEFISLLPEDGHLIASGDDPGVGRLLPRVRRGSDRVITYGLGAGNLVRAEDVRTDGGDSSFLVRERGRPLGRATLRVPGTHNIRNALAAISVARRLEAPWKDIREGIASYAGVDRRFERVGEERGILVVDDYAHHPTEIEATLSAARSAYPRRRLVAVFQPHLYSRTRDFAAEFARALAEADLVFITDIYAAREKPIEGITAELIVERADAGKAEVRYVADRASLPATVAEELRSGDLCLTLGAGDLDRAAREILGLLQRSLAV